MLAGAAQMFRSLVTAPRLPAGTAVPDGSEAAVADVAERFEQVLVDLQAGIEKTRQ